jgi:uncharacterized protein YcnI
MSPARALLLAIALLLLAPAAALAHAEMSPKVSLPGQLQLYSLAVPTEKDTARTVKVSLTLPKGFSIDSFVPAPGWHRAVKQTGSGEHAVIETVTWSGGHTPGGADSLFQFLAQAASPGTYTFTVVQSYSDGSVVNWSGPESSDSPAPRIDVRASVGAGAGGGDSTLSIVALIIGVLGLLAAGLALADRRGTGGGNAGEGRGRPLA